MSCTRQLLYFNFISINSLIFYLGFHFRYHVVYAGDCVPNRVTFTHDFRVKYFTWKYFCVFNDRHYLPYCPMNAIKENEREHEYDSLFYRESKHSNGSFSNVIQFHSACTSILYSITHVWCVHSRTTTLTFFYPKCCVDDTFVLLFFIIIIIIASLNLHSHTFILLMNLH